MFFARMFMGYCKGAGEVGDGVDCPVPSGDFSKKQMEVLRLGRAGVNVHPCTMTPKSHIRVRFSLGN